jgi:phosphorylcholine metabolism protein LicD
MRENFELMNKFLSERCDYFLEAGTALGFYRDGGIIEWDTDIDFGMLIENWNDAWIPELKKIGFRLLKDYRGRGRELTFKRNKVKVDIFLFFRNGDKRTCTAYDPKEFFMSFPAEMIENPKIVKGYPMPHPIEEYLTIRYGDWKTPVKDYDWRTPKCRDTITP